MATKGNPPQQRRSAEFAPSELSRNIEKLKRRIADLQEFDIAAVLKRGDASKIALEARIDNTLREILGDDTREYHQFSIRLDSLPLFVGQSPSAREVQANIQENVSGAVVRLNTLIEMMEEKLEDARGHADTPSRLPSPKELQPKRSSKSVFVVHGHDEGLRESVARFLGRLDLEPVILHEQADKGRTIIEKFEAHSDVDFAVVLFTPDDVGYAANREHEKRARPRQNVVLELGFFIGRLGRGKVCVLHKGDMEMLSDIAGVLYVAVEQSGHWQLRLAQEIKASGIDVDLNRLFG